jgi:hypothetical protein
MSSSSSLGSAGSNFHLANLLLPFCEAASINIKSADCALLKRIVVSLSLFNTEQLHDALFPNQHMDWVNLNPYLRNVCYSTSDWIMLVELIDFIQEIEPSNQQVQELLSSTLSGLQISVQGKMLTPFDSLRLCFAKGGISPTWDMLCKTFVLFNITDIDNGEVLEHFLMKIPLSSSSTKNAPLLAKNIQDILKSMTSIFRHSPEEFFQCFLLLFRLNSACHVRSHIILQSLRAREEMLEKKRFNSKSLYNAHEKPSLTKILEMQQQNKSSANSLCTTSKSSGGALIDSFSSFCEESRLPSTSNIHIKRILYFLKCLHKPFLPENVDLYADEKCIPCIVGNDPIILISLKDSQVIAPDVAALKMFLTNTYFTGVPFSALRHFRETCIPDSSHQPSEGGSAITWTTVFRLYLAVYCNPDYVKDLWLHVWGLCESSANKMSNNSSAMINYALTNSNSKNSVQTFTSSHCIDLHEVIRNCMENL